jgi:hypothetical protein
MTACKGIGGKQAARRSIEEGARFIKLHEKSDAGSCIKPSANRTVTRQRRLWRA